MRSSILLSTIALLGCGQAAQQGPPADEAPVAAEALEPLRVTPVTFTDAGDPVVEFSTPGMHCEACAATIAQKLSEQPTIVDVTADAESKVVSVTFTQTGFDAEASMAAAEAVATIAGAGFGEATPLVATEGKRDGPESTEAEATDLDSTPVDNDADSAT